MIKKKTHYKTDLAYYQISEGIKKFITKDTVIVCIGTDKCIGDCLGPLVGTLLKDNLLPLPVYGTISNPVHALNRPHVRGTCIRYEELAQRKHRSLLQYPSGNHW